MVRFNHQLSVASLYHVVDFMGLPILDHNLTLLKYVLTILLLRLFDLLLLRHGWLANRLLPRLAFADRRALASLLELARSTSGVLFGCLRRLDRGLHCAAKLVIGILSTSALSNCIMNNPSIVRLLYCCSV